jgi:hypothetical protein
MVGRSTRKVSARFDQEHASSALRTCGRHEKLGLARQPVNDLGARLISVPDDSDGFISLNRSQISKDL